MKGERGINLKLGFVAQRIDSPNPAPPEEAQSSFANQPMKALVYRGHKYNQHHEITNKNPIKLTYRRNVYKKKRHELISLKTELTYRGKKYFSKYFDQESLLGISLEEIFSLTREIIHNQFILGDEEKSNQLWNEVARRKIDPLRIINLMYGCHSPEDDQSMLEADASYLRQI